MGKYRVVIELIAQKQISLHYKSGNRATIKKLTTILNELSLNPESGEGNPEQLKYSLSGLWSRRINQKDRLIYKIEQKLITVFIISANGHYSHK